MLYALTWWCAWKFIDQCRTHRKLHKCDPTGFPSLSLNFHPLVLTLPLKVAPDEGMLFSSPPLQPHPPKTQAVLSSPAPLSDAQGSIFRSVHHALHCPVNGPFLRGPHKVQRPDSTQSPRGTFTFLSLSTVYHRSLRIYPNTAGSLWPSQGPVWATAS